MARGTGRKCGRGRGRGTASHGTPEPTNTSSTGLKITIPLFSSLRGGLPPPLDNGRALERDGPLPQNEPLPSTPTQEGEEEIVITPPPPRLVIYDNFLMQT